MKKILHIFPDSLFVDGYVQMLKKDKKHKHRIILTDIGSRYNTNIKNDKIFVGKVSTFKLFDFCKLNLFIKQEKCDKIIIHSCYLNFLVMSFIFNKKILKNASLILWGGQDCQKFKVPKAKWYFLPIGIVYEKLRSNIYKNVKSISCVMKNDFENVKKIYNLTCKGFETSYPYLPNIKNSFENGSKEKKTINVQVCHSGSIHANTLELLDSLSKYKDENIKLFAVLSYDDKNNCVEVEKKGKEIFGDKFEPITEYMLPADFASYISKLDIMISNAKIQQGLGNIYLGFASGARIVLRDDGVLKKNLEEKGYYINSISELLNDKKLLKNKLKKSEQEKNYNLTLEIFNTKEVLKKWEDIFDY